MPRELVGVPVVQKCSSLLQTHLVYYPEFLIAFLKHESSMGDDTDIPERKGGGGGRNGRSSSAKGRTGDVHSPFEGPREELRFN